MTSKKIRRVFLASLLAGSTMILSTGCSNGFSIASMNPFHSSPLPAAKQGESDSSLVAKSKEMFKRSTDAITAPFKADSRSAKVAKAKSKSPSAVDPLRLDHESKVGPDVFVLNGRLWESAGKPEKAMESYSKALEVKADDGDALASIARLHLRNGDNAKSIEFFQRAVQAKPDDASLHNDLGLTLSKSGNHVQGAQMIERALELSPGMSRYANNLASVRFEAGDAGGAYKVLAGNNKPAVAHYNMAYLHQKTGQFGDARNHLQAALKYEKMASTDSSIARAVERSKALLTQIDGPGAIAKSRAQTPSLAAAKLPQLPAVRQTSQTLGGTSADRTLQVRPATVRTPSAQEASTPFARLASAKLPPATAPIAKTPVAPAVAPQQKLPSASPPAPGGPFVLPPDFAVPKM